jgi:hypothetical protein
MANEIVGFDGLNFYFILVILSKLMMKCVIGFGMFVRVLEDQWKW